MIAEGLLHRLLARGGSRSAFERVIILVENGVRLSPIRSPD